MRKRDPKAPDCPETSCLAAQQAVEGRRPHLVVTCTVFLSPVVKYHGLARRFLTALGLLMRPLLNGGTLGGREMGIEVRLKRADGEVIGEVDDFRMTLARATSGPLTGTRLLRYLQPYGDAVFNQAQAGDLRDDIRQILRSQPGTPLAELLASVEPLVGRLSNETHVYLWFIGD